MHDNSIPKSPKLNKSRVNNISKTTLGVIGDCLAVGVGTGPSPEEPSLPAHKRHQMSGLFDRIYDPLLPLPMTWECPEVFWLKLCDNVFGQSGLLSQCCRLSTVI